MRLQRRGELSDWIAGIPTIAGYIILKLEKRKTTAYNILVFFERMLNSMKTRRYQ